MPRRKGKRLRFKSASPVLEFKRGKKRKTWTEDSMKAAMDAVREGVPVKRAALNHRVPRTTCRIVI